MMGPDKYKPYTLDQMLKIIKNITRNDSHIISDEDMKKIIFRLANDTYINSWDVNLKLYRLRKVKDNKLQTNIGGLMSKERRMRNMEDAILRIHQFIKRLQALRQLCLKSKSKKLKCFKD